MKYSFCYKFKWEYKIQHIYDIDNCFTTCPHLDHFPWQKNSFASFCISKILPKEAHNKITNLKVKIIYNLPKE